MLVKSLTFYKDEHLVLLTLFLHIKKTLRLYKQIFFLAQEKNKTSLYKLKRRFSIPLTCTRVPCPGGRTSEINDLKTPYGTSLVWTGFISNKNHDLILYPVLYLTLPNTQFSIALFTKHLIRTWQYVQVKGASGAQGEETRQAGCMARFTDM